MRYAIFTLTDVLLVRAGVFPSFTAAKTWWRSQGEEFRESHYIDEV